MRASANASIRVGEGSFDEFTGIDLWRNTDDAQLVTIQRLFNLRIGKVTTEEWIVDIDNRQISNLTC